MLLLKPRGNDDVMQRNFIMKHGDLNNKQGIK